VSPLAAAILTISLLPNGAPVRVFREHPLGAEGRATELAELFAEAGAAHNLDPYLLTALAWSESRFDSSQVGRVGERGLMQLHPRYVHGRTFARFRGSSHDRDRLSIFLGADALRHGLEACGERRVRYAIGWYKSGRCIAGPAAAQVMLARARLRRFAGVKS
jgi:hypothetical protein